MSANECAHLWFVFRSCVLSCFSQQRGMHRCKLRTCAPKPIVLFPNTAACLADSLPPGATCHSNGSVIHHARCALRAQQLGFQNGCCCSCMHFPSCVCARVCMYVHALTMGSQSLQFLEGKWKGEMLGTVNSRCRCLYV